MIKIVSMYGVFQSFGACELSVRPNTTRIRPHTIVSASSQSMVACGDVKGCRSEDIQSQAVMIMMKTRIASVQKYQLHGKVCPLSPPKNIPEKKSRGLQAPYKLKIKFLRGPGR